MNNLFAQIANVGAVATLAITGYVIISDLRNDLNQSQEKLVEIKEEVNRFSELRNELTSLEQRIVTYQENLPDIVSQASQQANIETEAKIATLADELQSIKLNDNIVPVLPDGLLEIEGNLVYDLVPGSTFVAKISESNSIYTLTLHVDGVYKGTQGIGKHFQVGPNNACKITFISGRKTSDNQLLANIRKNC